MILYIYPATCTRVTMSALEELGVDYEHRVVDFSSDAQYSPEYLGINRKGKVPALIVDGRLLTETPAILIHLESTAPGTLLPSVSDPLDRAAQISDLVWCGSTLHPMIRQIRAPKRFTDGDVTEVRQHGMTKFASEAAFLSERLSGGRWWLGETWSILDVYLYWLSSNAAKGGFPTADYPALMDHAERVRARPSFRRALAKEIAAVTAGNLPIDIATL